MAVVVIALVATAALRLVVLSQKNLIAVREKERFLDQVAAVQTAVKIEELRESGTSGDIEWETKLQRKLLFDGDPRALFKEMFGEGNIPDFLNDIGRIELKWREITITQNTQKGQKLVLCLYPEDDLLLGGGSGDQTSSGDKSGKK